MVRPHDFLRKNTHNSAGCCLFLCFYVAPVHCCCRNNGIHFNVPTFTSPGTSWRNCAPLKVGKTTLQMRPPIIDWSGGVARAKFDYLERDEAENCNVGMETQVFETMDEILRELNDGNYVSKYWHIFCIIHLHHSSPNPSGQVLWRSQFDFRFPTRALKERLRVPQNHWVVTIECLYIICIYIHTFKRTIYIYIHVPICKYFLAELSIVYIYLLSKGFSLQLVAGALQCGFCHGRVWHQS